MQSCLTTRIRCGVLVVDDEQSIAEVVSMALRHHGLIAVSVDTAREALVGARAWRPHVMLLDTEGLAVAWQLAAERAEVPILSLSARDDAADKVRGLMTDGDKYVTKPFSLEGVDCSVGQHDETLGCSERVCRPVEFRGSRARRGRDGGDRGWPRDRADGNRAPAAAVFLAQPASGAVATLDA